MKKLLILVLSCQLILSGCGRSGKPLFDPVYLYYPRVEFDYGDSDSVITSVLSRLENELDAKLR